MCCLTWTTLRVTRLGIDEHRYRSVRFFRDEGSAWRRYQPWMTTLVDLTTGQVLGVVDGRCRCLLSPDPLVPIEF